MIHWRFAQVDDIPALRHIARREFGHDRDIRSGVQILVLADGDEIKGFTMLQRVVHMEPTWIAPEHRNIGILTQMASRVRAEVQNESILFAFTQDDRIVRLMEAFGFKEIVNWRILRRVLGREPNEQLIRRPGKSNSTTTDCGYTNTD